VPYYQIDMNRRESGGLVQHYNPIAASPARNLLASFVETGHPEVGRIQQVTCERHSNGSTRQIVLGHLARDIELLSAIAGDIRRVSAIGPDSPDASFASLQTQMTAARVPAVRWNVATTSAATEALIVTLVGESGTLTLREVSQSDSAARSWRLETRAGNSSEVEELPADDAAATAIEQFAAAIAQTDRVSRTSSSTWESATRAMEVVEAVEIGLHKGRTTEVIQQHLTEKLAFRGVMAALGCGMLLLAFFAVIGIAMFGGIESLLETKKAAGGWAAVLLAVLAVFLLVQAVPFLIVKRDGGAKDKG
jgi:hypothetical protein